MILLGVFSYVLHNGANKIVLPAVFKNSNLPFGAIMRRAIYMHVSLSIVVSSLGAVMSSVAYYFLRSEKEGTTADELGRVFE